MVGKMHTKSACLIHEPTMEVKVKVTALAIAKVTAAVNNVDEVEEIS